MRASRWGQDRDYYVTSDDDLMLVAQIESLAAIDNIEAICAVPGIDMLLIGPRDLAGSMGRLDRFDDPALWREVRRAETAILKSGRKLASSIHPGRTVRSMFADGYDLVLCGKDVDFLMVGARTSLAAAIGNDTPAEVSRSGLPV